MSEEKQPISRKSSSMNGDNHSENGKDVINNNNNENDGGGGEVTLKAKMSLVNGCTVIVGSIIGE